MVLENALELESRSEDFRKKLLELPEIEEVTFSTSVPGKALHMKSFQSGKERKSNHLMYVMESDSLFFKTYRISLT